jgi:electron transport complex protein RnfG
MKVGFNADGIVWNVKVLSHAETPGLGAKCTEPSFSDQFCELDPSDEKNLNVKKDGGNLNAITASTITSRAYADGVAQAVEVFKAIVATPMPLNDMEE